MVEPQRFFISVQAILKAGNEVLVIHKSKAFYDGQPLDVWALPGGKIDPNEHEMEALERELKEELDFNWDKSKNPAVYAGYYLDNHSENSFKGGISVCILKYLIEIDEKFNVPENDEEFDKAEWISWRDFLELRFHSRKVPMKELLNGIAIQKF